MPLETTPKPQDRSRRENQKVQQAVDGIIGAFLKGDPDMGEMHAHLPFTEIIEWKGTANVWNATVEEFRETVEARKEEPISQETVQETIEWISDLTALVFRRVKTTIPDGRSFVAPALFLVVPDREGTFRVVLSWWGSFPDWFQA